MGSGAHLDEAQKHVRSKDSPAVGSQLSVGTVQNSTANNPAPKHKPPRRAKPNKRRVEHAHQVKNEKRADRITPRKTSWVPRKLLGSISSPLVMRNLRAAEAQCIAVGGGWGKHSNENRPQVNERGCAQYIEVQSRSSELLCYRQPNGSQ